MEYQHGGDVYSNQGVLDLSSNINPYKIPASISKAIKNGVSLLPNYPDSQCRKLKHALEKKYGIWEYNFICGNGAADLIFSLVYAVKPKRALLLAPCFSEYEQALQNMDTKILRYYMKEKTGFALDSGILNYLTSEIDLFFLCSPNNPTGRQVEPDLRDAILEKCNKNNILIVMDECFLDFCKDMKQSSSIGYIDKYPNLFVLKSFTKMYGLAGLRLGYGICSDQNLLEKIEASRQPWSVSILAQCAGIAALKEHAFIEETVEKLSAERKWLMEHLEPYVKKIYPSEANFILFEAEENLKEKMLKKHILIRDCSNYQGLSKGFYRIAVKDHKSNHKFVSAMKSRKR